MTRRMALFTLPELALPFPHPGCHPGVDEASRDVFAWCDEQGLFSCASDRRGTADARPELVAALYYPSADARVLRLTSRFIAWAFLVDTLDDKRRTDDVAECEAIVASLVGVVTGHALPRTPLERAGHVLVEDLSAPRSAAWRRSFVDHLAAWLPTYIAEARHRAAGTAPLLEEYLPHRRDGFGVPWLLDLCESALGIDLPDSVRDLEGYRALRDATADAITLVNDLVSAPKEMADGYGHQAVSIAMHHERCDPQAAAHLVAALWRERVAAIPPAEERLLAELTAGDKPDARRDVARCAHAYRVMTAGNFMYHFQVGRYERRGTEPVATGDRMAIFVDSQPKSA